MNSRDISPLPLSGARTSFGTRLIHTADGSLKLGWHPGTIVFFALTILVALAAASYAFHARKYEILVFAVPILLIMFFCIWRGQTVRLNPLVGELRIGREVFPFDQIAALQVASSPAIHQLNLVTVYGARYNLLSGAPAKAVRALAQEMAAAIGGIPVFDRELEVEPVATDGVIRAENLVWIPVAPGGTNLRTHRLVPTPESGYTFKPSFGRLFRTPFSLAGAISLLLGIVLMATGHREGLFLLPSCLFLGGPLVWNLYLRLKQPFFDPMDRIFYRGRRHRAPVPFDEIVALQILSEMCRPAKDSPFLSYELNLVLKDNRRINVVDHSDRTQLRSDAETLAEFLKVPLLER